MIRRIAVLSLLLGLYLPSLHAFASEVGRTPGQFGVSRLGSSEYQIPIWTPPGIRGIQPHLALVYDSNLAYGFIGPGWTITGLSAIARCNPTYAQDGTPAPITLTSADGLCLDGNRLRGTPAGSTTTYQTEIANFSQVTASGTAGNGPSYFTVQGKDGLTYEYGNTTDSKILPSSSTSTPYIWALDKVTDRAGNQMTFTYFQAGGAYVPLSIQYTAPSGSTTFPYQVSFVYSTKAQNDRVTKYVAGTQVQQTEQLSSIKVTSSGTTVHVYNLSYTTSSQTLRATLTSIQECGGVGGTDCLPATSVGYQYGSAGVASPSTASGSGATNGTVYSVDINGDGLQDLIFATTSGSNYKWWVQFASASGYGAPISTGALTSGTQDFLIDNFAGTQAAQLLAPVGGIWYVYKWNGTSFTATSTGVSVISGTNYVSADVNGDGLPDLVNIANGETALKVGIQLNTSAGGSVSFATSPVTSSLPVTGAVIEQLSAWGDNQVPNSSLKKMDFDGDGRQDILIYTVLSGGEYGASYYVFPLLSRGTSTPVLGTGIPNSAPPLEIGNWNDDACTDLFVGSTVLVSPCNGSAAISVALPNAASIAIDWDGDGRTDVLANVGGIWELYRSEGTTFATGVSTGITVGSGTYTVTDKDGDGLDDLILANSSAGNALYYGLHNGAGKKPDLVTSIVDGFGNSSKPTYVALSEGTSTYTNNTNASYPYQNYIGPLYVVNQATFSDPSSSSGATYNLTYTYYYAWTNLQGRGFAGFDNIGIIDSRNPTLMDVPLYRQDFPYTGMSKGHQVWEKGTGHFNNPVLQTSVTLATTTLDSTTNNQRYFPWASNNTTTNYEYVGPVGSANDYLITTSSIGYTYDNYGNALTVDTTVTDNDPNSPYTGDTWTVNVANTPDIATHQTADLAAWCLNMLDESQVAYSSKINGANTITLTKQFAPDTPANCRILTMTTEPTSSLYKVTETVTYDGFGNIATDTATGVNVPLPTPATREIKLNWGTTGQFLTTLTDPSGAATNWVFTSPTSLTFGLPDSVTDANNLKTSFGYDDFGRKISEVHPDLTSTTWTWSLCSAHCGWGNSVYEVAQNAYQTDGKTVIRTDTNLYDPIDRVTQTAGPNLTGATATVQTAYYPLGMLYQQSLPFLSGGTAYQQTYDYDILKRLTSVARPISSSNSTLQTTSYAYAGRKLTITDANNNPKTTISDVNGWLRQITDAQNFTVTRAYDPAGSLTGITDSAGNTLLSGVTYNYGIKPFLAGATDADLGAWTYTLDSFGERTSWKDAKGQPFSMTYDVLSRPSSRTEPDLTTTWTWGLTPGSYNVGKLQSVSSADSLGTYSESYTYDTHARLSTETIQIPQDSTYTYTSTYSTTTGLLATLQYPVSTSSYQMTLQYAYQHGILDEITDATTGVHYWLADAANARGQLTQETLGNNVVVNHTFDAVTGWVGSIQAGVGGGAALQNNSYLFDQVGNLSQRQDGVASLTENLFPDNVYRLDHSTLNGAANLQNSYDATGNVTAWSLGGSNTLNYTTPQAGCTYYAYSQPHAVRSQTTGGTTQSFCYDANGNMLTGPWGSVYTWTSYNKLDSASMSGNSSQLYYNGNHRRYKQVATGYPDSLETTYYIGGLMEKMVTPAGTAFRHFIPAGSNTALYVRWSTGSNPTYYITKDHLGGSSTITDSSGNLSVTERFTAWGWRTDDWTASQPTAAEFTDFQNITRRGFTGHEMLDNVSLVNMNGRVMASGNDIPRMLSPDPNVPDPSNTQSYNRYSYVNNNPLSLVDPTGFDDESPQMDDITVLGTRIIDVTANFFDDTGGFLGDTLGDIWKGLEGVFGGGGSHLSAYQQKVVKAGLGNAQNLQSGPGATSPAGQTLVGTEDGTSTTNVAVTAASAQTVTIGQTLTNGQTVTSYGAGYFVVNNPDGSIAEVIGTGTITQNTPLPGVGPTGGAHSTLKNWLCNHGNSLAEGADYVGKVSGILEISGVGIGVTGLVTAQPEVAVPGFALAAAGGTASIGAGLLQFGAGLMQGFGGGGFQNSYNAAATLGASATVGWLFRAPGVSGYRTVSQRASDSFLQNTQTTTGGVFDTLTSFIQQLGPQQVTCP